MSAGFVIERLGRQHDRSGFVCGVERIDRYARDGVTQDVRRRYAVCFVARRPDANRIAGFYTLSSAGVPLLDLPDSLARKLPRYPTVPAVLIGWLGRHLDHAGEGLGELLLVDAIRTVAESPIGAHAVFADAIDEAAAAFYRRFGFTALAADPMRLFLPLAMARTLFGAASG